MDLSPYASLLTRKATEKRLQWGAYNPRGRNVSMSTRAHDFEVRRASTSGLLQSTIGKLQSTGDVGPATIGNLHSAGEVRRGTQNQETATSKLQPGKVWAVPNMF